MQEVFLTYPAGYDRKKQAMVGLFAAQLDDLLLRLKRAINGLTTSQLEWQPRPGINTVGMLLAHLALTELWWLKVVATEMPVKPDGEQLIASVFGEPIDDGLPLAADGRHPQALLGKKLDDYLRMLNKARASIHETMRKWTDADLERRFTRKDECFSLAWIIYHVLEHFAGHLGQIHLLKHMMRDEGILHQS